MIPATSEAVRRALEAQLRNRGLGGLTGNPDALGENARYLSETDEAGDFLRDRQVQESSTEQICKEMEEGL
jgi:hypothetical protein